MRGFWGSGSKRSHSPAVSHTNTRAHTRGHNPNFCDLLAFLPNEAFTDQRAHQPTLSSSLLKSQQLYLTCNINNLIYFPAPLFLSPTHPTEHTHTNTQKGLLSPILLSVSAGNVSHAAFDKNNFLHHWSHRTCFSLLFFSSSSWSSSMKMVFLEVLLLNDEVNVRRWLCFIKSSRGKTVTIHTEMKWIARGETHHGHRHWRRGVPHAGCVAYCTHTNRIHVQCACVCARRYERIRACAHLFVPVFSCGHCWHCLRRVEEQCRLSGCHFETAVPQINTAKVTHLHTLGLCNHSLHCVLLHSLHQPGCCLSYYSPNCHAYGNLSSACYPLH